MRIYIRAEKPACAFRVNWPAVPRKEDYITLRSGRKLMDRGINLWVQRVTWPPSGIPTVWVTTHSIKGTHNEVRATLEAAFKQAAAE